MSTVERTENGPIRFGMRRAKLLAACVLALAGVAAYANSFSGAFIFDDHASISDNPTIQPIWPLSRALCPPRGGETVSGRPLLNLSFALNYAVGELNVWGYHAANLAIHILAALTLFAILVRTFQSPRLQNRFGDSAIGLSMAISLLWLLHPLQTESVTYIVQRAESLMGLLYLLTLYCVIRGSQSRWPVGWYVLATLTCLAGMATKEVMVTAPLVVLLYDRTFLTGSFPAALRRRWALYLGLAATWGLLFYLVWSTGCISQAPDPGHADLSSYARTQPEVILHYLRLSFWPRPLCLDYWWPVADSWGRVLPGLFVVGGLLLATFWAWRRDSAWGFLGAWFFLILAPTSSLLPLNDLAFEHRMYLPLAAVIAALVLCVDAAIRAAVQRGWLSSAVAQTAGGTILVALALVAGTATLQRNMVYHSEVAVWQDTLATAPNNPRVHNNLAFLSLQKGDMTPAIDGFRRALRVNPNYGIAHLNLGNALVACGRFGEAAVHYQRLLEIKPDFAEGYNNLGVALSRQGQTAEAVQHYRQALQSKPDYGNAHYNLAAALAGLGNVSEAIEHYRQALQLLPDDADTHIGMGTALYRRGQWAEALLHWRAGLKSQTGNLAALNLAAWVLATHPDAALRNGVEAVRYAERAAELCHRGDPAVLDTLAAAYAEAGQFSEAVAIAGQAKELAGQQSNQLLVGKIEARIRLYESKTPFRDTDPAAAAQPRGGSAGKK